MSANDTEKQLGDYRQRDELHFRDSELGLLYLLYLLQGNVPAENELFGST